MVFNSLTFVVFFALVLVLHHLPLPWRIKKINLLIASYLFYAAWNPPFVILLWVSTVVDWYAAQKLVQSERQGARRAWMWLSVVANLGMLSYFKYGGFLLANFEASLGAFGISYTPPAFDIVLPVGISFYTFATMSYTLDVYLRRAAPARNFLDYALFVTFFPHLVAGPIMRPTELVPQFAAPRRASPDMLRFGLALMTLGLFQKIVLADSFLAKAAEMVYDSKDAAGAVDAWIGTLAFSGQIFCDFAGYSTTAIGAAMCLGFAMPDNFRFPYAAVGFSDFWRRWHITLSSWLRDYLYIPLGGNRHGPARTYLALMLTMLLGGLWHGASWTFVVWGGLHGAYLAMERALRSVFANYRPGPLMLVLFGLITYLLVNITWVFFRAHTFGKAWQLLGGMFGAHGDAAPILPTMQLTMVTLIVGGIVLAHWSMRGRTLEMAVATVRPMMLAGIWASMAVAIVIAQAAGNAFIYFQFYGAIPLRDAARPGFVRQTAADRPGVAQPVPERDIPAQPWGRILTVALVLTCVALAGWEAYWRADGAVASYLNSKGAWAEQRRRIDAGDGDHTVLIGASRVLFDIELPVWESLTGERPIQLALEGTTPVPFLEDLADDPNFTGRLLIGVAPDVFFSGFGYRGDVLPYYRKQSPSQRCDHWLSQRLMEPYFAFYDPDFALATVIARQAWPARAGLTTPLEVRKLAVMDADRNAHLWRKLEVDPSYQALARSIWAQDFGKPPPDMETPEKRRKVFDAQIAKAASAIAKLRARGVPVVFVRAPSNGEYYAYEQTYFPREETWDPLLQRTGAPGIHFDDHPQLQGFELPEWSHLTSADADRFTAALVPLVMVEFAR